MGTDEEDDDEDDDEEEEEEEESQDSSFQPTNKKPQDKSKSHYLKICIPILLTNVPFLVLLL